MSNNAPEAAMPAATPKYAWVVLFALYLASLAAPLNMFKLPPVMTTLASPEAGLGLNAGDMGSLMSIFSIMGFILAIPAGFILKRFGIKLVVLFAVGAITVGAVLGALSAAATQLYIGRFIEGTGMGLVMVAAPLAISIWFPANNRALPTGLWATCVGIGNIVPLFVAPLMVGDAHNWQIVWWAGAIFAAVAFVVFALVFRMPRPDEMETPPAPPPAAGEAVAQPSLFQGMRNINYWLIGIGFGAYNLIVLALLSFLPMFLEMHRGYAADYSRGLIMSASFVTAFVMLASIFTGPGGGFISDRIGKRKAVVLAVYAIMTVSLLLPFTGSFIGWTIPVFMIVFGIFGGPIAPILLASVPEVSKMPQLIGIGMACAALLQNLGMFIGPTLFMGIVNASGGVGDIQSWVTAGYCMIPVSVIGMIAVWRIKVR